jgi:hypothetical protein
VHIGYQRRLMRCSISTILYRYCGWQLSDYDDGCCATDTESASSKDGTLELRFRPSLALLQGVHAGRQCPGYRHRAGVIDLLVNHRRHSCSLSCRDMLLCSFYFRGLR